MIFDGKAFAEKIISKLPRKKAKLAIFLSEDNISGVRYVKIKTETAQRLGVEVEVTMTNPQIPMNIQVTNIKSQIEKLNKDETVTGIMIQLPLGFDHLDLDIASGIAREKDVDGLRDDSPYLPAAVLAVKKILDAYSSEFMVHGKIAIVGSNGFIGQKLIKLLRTTNNELIAIDKDNFDSEKIKLADIVISATGQAGLIKDIKNGAVCIDLGFPKGDFNPEVAKKASFFTPVPGGVGPVTVACLFENLLIHRGSANAL